LYRWHILVGLSCKPNFITMAENNTTEQNKVQNKPGTSRRGFASMDKARQREIASKGGKAAHQQGVAHQWSREEARVAGRKGGETVSRNKDHMSEIGRKGGEASHRRESSAAASDQL
jgi:general stress protein YciG